MRSSGLPMAKRLSEFDFTLQPSQRADHMPSPHARHRRT
jgi:hypothetical protein